MTNKLSAKDQQFADLYFGGPDDLIGNATACYRYLHPRAKDNTCQVEGSKILSKPMVDAYLQSKREKLTEVTGINAEYVLRQSIRLYDRAVGDEAVELVNIETDKDTGAEHVTVVEQRTYDPQTAKAALQLIGQHKDIQAFRVNVEHSHTHRLAQRLAKRGKEVENAAARRNAIIEGKAEVIEAEDAGGEAQAVEKTTAERKLELVK